MILEPINDNIIVKIESEDNKEKIIGGIYIPSSITKAEKPDTGIVESVGEGRILNSGKRIKPSVEKGDKIIFNKFAGTEVSCEGDTNKYLIIKENDILIKIKE